MPKRALLLSPYFTPSNLAAVQRTRLMASHLDEFDWEPIVVCVDSAYYEEASDPASLALLPDRLRVERVSALPASLCRPLGFGDVSLRAQWNMRSEVAKLVRREKIDIIFATVLPGYAGLVGAWAKRKFELPFVLDYQDPWVSASRPRQSIFSKAGLSDWIATKVEPGAIAVADGLTAVSSETLDTLRQRKLIRPGIPIEIIPIGADENDHAIAEANGKSHIIKEDGVFDFAYLGTLTERMLPALKTVLIAMQQAGRKGSLRRLRLHLIGTSARPDGQDELGIASMARTIAVDGLIKIEPRRVPYLDALRTMQDADGLLLIGSTDSHYTASKLFPCWLSHKPILALVHAKSTVNQLGRELGGLYTVNYDDTAGANARIGETTLAVWQITESGAAACRPRNERAFELYSAAGVAKRYAALFDKVIGVNQLRR